MSAGARWMAVGLAALALACGDIASPRRDRFLRVASVRASPSGSGATIRSASTGRPERLPVRIWVGGPLPLPASRPGHRRLASRVPVRGIRRDDRERLRNGRRDRASPTRPRRPALGDPAAQRHGAGVLRGHRPGRERRPHPAAAPIRIFIDPLRPRRPRPRRPAWRSPRSTSWATPRHLPAFAQPRDIMFSDPAVDAPSPSDAGSSNDLPRSLYHVPARAVARRRPSRPLSQDLP